MKVSELIEELQEMDQDLEVKFSYNYGDHWHTQVAANVEGAIMGRTKYSEYHQMHKVLEDDNDESGKTVVLLVDG
jgi:hypothetical protein